MYYSKILFLDSTEVCDFESNEEVTLMNWGNAIVNEAETGSVSTSLTLHLDGDYKTTKKKVLWISAINAIDVVISTYNKDRKEFSVPKKTEFYGEPGMRAVKKGEYIQLMKMGYYLCDKVDDQSIHLTEIN